MSEAKFEKFERQEYVSFSQNINYLIVLYSLLGEVKSVMSQGTSWGRSESTAQVIREVIKESGRITPQEHGPTLA